ncbi:MAG: hypothetical protein ACRCUY_06545 [Thermoguttaceae bacterium]
MSHISYKLVPFGDFEHLFLIVTPPERFVCIDDDTQGHGLSVPDWSKQVHAMLESVRATIQTIRFTGEMLMGTFFISDIAQKELVRYLCREFFPDGLGAVTFVPQTPADGSIMALELWGIQESKTSKPLENEENNAKRPKSRCLFHVDSLPGRVHVVDFDNMKWFFGGDMKSGNLPIGAYSRSLNAFEQLKTQLKQNEFAVSQIIRTWIYQGHLVLAEGNSQRYKELNRARTDFFENVDFLQGYLPQKYKESNHVTVYPASTGIGADDMDLVIGAVAIATDRDDFIAVPLENPNQTSAFDYGAVYSPQSPKFSRAMAVATKNTALIFVSGTASITESESRYENDPVRQTELTLDNIAALISGSNLEAHGVHGFDTSLSDMAIVRVYVKRPAELELIRKVCEKRLGKIPILYTIADVCRPELLVEIEGICVK